MRSASKPRLVSLDVFRGLTILLMIVVNSPGAGAEPWAPLLHAEWHGLTLTDLVFPSFLFAVGNAIPFATSKWHDLTLQKRVLKIFTRAALIFLVGYLLNWYTSMHWNEAGQLQFKALSQLRVMGVLQRIGLCYLFAAMLAEFLSSRHLVWLSILMLLGYWALLFFLGDPVHPYAPEDNAIIRLDRIIFPEQMLYRERGIVFDPEGILSTIPSIVNVLAGTLLGRWILEGRPVTETITRIMVYGSLLLLAGTCWSWIFPINKKLWTSSFVLCTVGIDLLVMGLLLYVHKVKNRQTGVYFFSVFGRNPLFIYVLSNLILFFFILPVGKIDLHTWVNQVFFQRWFAGPMGSLLFATSIGLLCWFFGWLLDRKKIYIRL